MLFIPRSARSYLPYRYMSIMYIHGCPWGSIYIGQVQIRKLFERKIVDIFLRIDLKICFGCSKELSQ